VREYTYRTLVLERKPREWTIHWRSTTTEFGLGGSPPAPTLITGNSTASIVSFAICTPYLPRRRVRDSRKTGEIVLLSEKVLFIVAGLLAVVLAIAALVMWAF
jgi:hypothetical protein